MGAELSASRPSVPSASTLRRSRPCTFSLLAVLFLVFGWVHPDGLAPEVEPLVQADAALLQVAAEYYDALARSGGRAGIRFWNEASPESARNCEDMEKIFPAGHLFEAPVLRLFRVSVDAEWAWICVSVDIKTVVGTAAGQTDVFPLPRALRCRFEDGRWKIWDERSAAEDLALALIAARSGEAVSALLADLQESEKEGLAATLAGQSLGSARKGDLDTALRIAQLSRRLAEETGNRTDLAEALNREGTIWGMKGRYDRAVARLEGAAHTWPPEELAQRSSTMFNLGRALQGTGDYDRALSNYKACLAIREKLGNPKAPLNVLQNMGPVYYDLGNYRAALDAYLRSLALMDPADAENAAKSLVNIGNVHNRQGEPELALDHYRRAMERIQPLAPHRYQAIIENNIGSAYQRMHNYAAALEHFRKSLALRNPQEPEGIAIVLNNIASMESALGNSGEAEKHWQESLRLSEEIGNSFILAWIRKEHSFFDLKSGRLADALAEAEQAIAIARSHGQADILTEALTSAGKVQLALGKTDAARRAFDEAIQVTETMRSQVAGGESARESFFEEKLSPYQQMVALLVKLDRPSEALAYVERAKARVLGEILRGGRARFDRFMTLAEREEDQRLNAELASLHSRLAQSGENAADWAGLQDQQRQIRFQQNDFQHRLYAEHPELAVARGEAPPLGTAELLALVPDPQTALLEYLVLPERTFLFVLTRTVGRKSRAMVSVYAIEMPEAKLAGRIQDFRERLTGNDPACGRPAQTLYELLLAPAAEALRNRTRLVIAPDDVLWDLPFAALQSAPDHFLLDDAAIDLVPSLGVWPAMGGRRPAPARQSEPLALLAFGNPELPREFGFVPLPEAEAEVRALASIYGPQGVAVYTGGAADESRFKGEAPQARVLHLATHGVLDGASPLYSYLALASGGSGEDGLLEAREILEMELGADVAVLSACETARGRIGAGEGVIGLSWALFVSGCATTVVSLWPVESAATTELMVAFHHGLRGEGPGGKPPLPPAEALRRAALRLRQQPATRHPFYWAGFITVGRGF
jgi:CHAT domain-containing protein/tetratricopeptide (TPR) repeat protein